MIKKMFGIGIKHIIHLHKEITHPLPLSLWPSPCPIPSQLHTEKPAIDSLFDGEQTLYRILLSLLCLTFQRPQGSSQVFYRPS